MRRTWFHILMAFIVGLWSPLCCCQAGLVIGTLTGVPASCSNTELSEHMVSEDDSQCCGHCGGNRNEPPTPSTDLEGPEKQLPGESTPCNDCPACQGTLGVQQDTTDSSSVLKSITSEVPIFCYAMLPTWSVAGSSFPSTPRKSVDHSGRGGGGRAILRLHCALVV